MPSENLLNLLNVLNAYAFSSWPGSKKKKQVHPRVFGSHSHRCLKINQSKCYSIITRSILISVRRLSQFIWISWKILRLNKIPSENMTKWSLCFMIIPLALHTIIPSMLQCLGPIGKNSHEQNIWRHHTSFSAQLVQPLRVRVDMEVMAMGELFKSSQCPRTWCS